MASGTAAVDSQPAHPTTHTPRGRRLLPDTWEARDDGRAVLFATVCGRCGAWTFPVARACPRCWERVDLRREELGRQGTVAAFSIVHVAADGIDAPYALAYVDFPGGTRLCGRLAEWSGVAVGDTVETVVGALRTRRSGDLVGWLFRKVT